MIDLTERVGAKMQDIDFTQTKPVTGIFGMISAMKRPEVQEGLGVLIELSTVMSAFKQEAPSQVYASHAT